MSREFNASQRYIDFVFNANGTTPEHVIRFAWGLSMHNRRRRDITLPQKGRMDQ